MSRGYSNERSHNRRSHTVNLEVDLNYVWSAHHTRFLWTLMRSAHTRFADLNTAKISGSALLTPPENGAGNFWVPSKCQHFPGKTGFSSDAR